MTSDIFTVTFNMASKLSEQISQFLIQLCYAQWPHCFPSVQFGHCIKWLGLLFRALVACRPR